MDKEKKTTREDWPPCDICGKPVTTKDGLLVVSQTEIHAEQERERELEKKKHEGANLPGADPWGEPHTVKDILAYRSVPWKWGHDRCLQVVINPYGIEAERFQTPADALGWTLHLMEKVWIGFTSWQNTVRRFHKVAGP